MTNDKKGIINKITCKLKMYMPRSRSARADMSLSEVAEFNTDDCIMVNIVECADESMNECSTPMQNEIGNKRTKCKL